MRRVVSVTPLPVERDSRTYKQAASLARMGYESVVVEGEASSLDPASLPFRLVAVADAGAPRAQPLAYLRWNLRTLRALPTASLYILHSYRQFPAVYLKTRRNGAPYAYDAHDSYWEHDPDVSGPRPRSPSARAFERMERFCASRAAALLTVSDGVAGLLERRFGRRPVVVRNAADLRLERRSPGDVRTAAGVGPDDFLLAMPGNAKPGDTIREAVQAVSMVPGRVHLALVGSGNERFAELARERGIGDRVHVLPPVPPTEVADFISTADAAPILYRAWTVNFLHALPNRFFHAVAAGLPILYPPLVEIAALCEEHGLGLPIEPTDPGSVAEAIRALSEDPALAARLRANVEAARPALSWEHEEKVLGKLVAAQLEPGAG